MAHNMKDIPASILATEGTNVKTGVLSILEKKGIKILKSTDYQLNPLYWRLVSYAGQTYLLGHTKQLGGAKAIKKLLVKGCSTEMNLPEKVVVSTHSNETFLCIQCGEKITFLKAETKHQRNKWVDAIKSAIKEPIYYPSTNSTTSTDSSDSFDVLRDRDQRLPRSVHNTADTAPRPGVYWRRVNTSPAGQFQMANRASLSSIPSSAHALAQQRRRSQEMDSAIALQSQQSPIHSLNSVDRMRSSSQHELNISEIDDDGAQYNGLESVEDYGVSLSRPFSLSSSTSTSQPDVRVQLPVPNKLYTRKSRNKHSGTETKALHQAESRCDVNEPGYIEIDDDKEVYPPIPHPSPPDLPADNNVYMIPLKDNDDQSSVSRVNNLGLESGENADVHIYDYTIAPEPPKRDYQNRKSVVKEGLVKKTSSKKTRAPQPPQTHIDLRGKMNSQAPNCESLYAYIQRFRRELFRKDGFTVEVDKTDLSPKTMKLVCVADCICIAALLEAKLHSLLHVDDVIVKVNRQTLPSIDFCYKLFRTTDENKVQLHIKRVMHGILCHVTLSANGDVDSLGLEFGNQSQGNEVTAMHSEGLVAKSGSLSGPQTHGVVNGGMLVNWGLVEINQSPVSFDSSPADVRDHIQRAGCELALVFIPMDLINVFKERPCGESTDQASTGEGTC